MLLLQPFAPVGPCLTCVRVHRRTAPAGRRAMNKSAIVNCRWTVRPVRSDGQSLPGKDGKEVSNMDHVFFEQVRGESNAPMVSIAAADCR